MNTLTMGEVAARTLADEMRRDERIWVLGEDVQFGGIFQQYKGLYQEFGAKRVVNTPIAESTIMGAGLGAALVGTRPVIEMRIADFVMPAIDELVNQIAKVRYMFGGQGRACPMGCTPVPPRNTAR
jgi:acetoin:2,6-dichlorophenolindophenol oxidoreductase subunit beta